MLPEYKGAERYLLVLDHQIHSLTHSFILSFIHASIHSFIHWCIRALVGGYKSGGLIGYILLHAGRTQQQYFILLFQDAKPLVTSGVSMGL